MKGKVKVAVIQAAPVYYNLRKSMDKALALIRDAAEQKARVIALGETWLPGYPAWLDYCSDASRWDHLPVKEVFSGLKSNSIVVPGKETALLSAVAKKYKVVIAIGVNEKNEKGAGSGTLYNSLLIFDEKGKLAVHHRKLVPTYSEKMVWGHGDSAGLKVADTSSGRIGGLICWEHWMPLSRQALHNQAEQIHIALWPGVKEMHQVASRHYAFEGRCFVLAAGIIMKASDLPKKLAIKEEKAGLLIKGGSAIVAPDGRYLAGPVFDKETILTATIDLDEIDRESMTLDTTGHYYREDIFNFSVNPGKRIK